MIKMPSPNFDQRLADVPVDMLVLHYTGMQTTEAALQRLCDPEAKVSSHYLIDELGQSYQLVDEADRAWHAGVSFWRGHSDINARSIGVEIVNPGHEFGYREFPEAQMIAVEQLAMEILQRHPIPARNVVGHSDVAPGRKTDPGELFDWQRLARQGIGLWPAESDFLDMLPETMLDRLSKYGYSTDSLSAAVKAFQRHFRPTRVNGRIDGETARLLSGLVDDCLDRVK